MLTPTHLVAAQSSYLVVCVIVGHPPVPEEAAVALLGGLIPDLDTRASYVGRVLRLTSSTLERFFAHRSFTHSLVVQTIGGLLAWWLLPGGFALALITGWVSHSWCDMMTKGGVAWFWPARIRCVLPGNPEYRMEVMGGAELAFLLISILVGVLMMPLAATGSDGGRSEGVEAETRVAVVEPTTTSEISLDELSEPDSDDDLEEDGVRVGAYSESYLDGDDDDDEDGDEDDDLDPDDEDLDDED